MSGSVNAIVLAGPTGVGKSRVAARLAERCGGEVVSADSVQAYKCLDVGSGKPSEAEQRGVPHHLIGVLDPMTESWSASSFMRSASEIVQSIAAQNKLAVVAGGTGFYLQWLLRGSPGTPPASEATQAAAKARIARAQRSAARAGADPWLCALNELHDTGDASGAQQLHRNDWYRLQRRLEIALQAGHPADEFGHGLGLGVQPPENVVFQCFVLHKPRIELYRSIDERCEGMLRDGLLGESLWLLRHGLQPGDSPATRAIGYRQAMEFLQWMKQQRSDNEYLHCTANDLLSFLQRFQRESRNYAKRQLNWFRSKHATEFSWVDARFSCDTIVDALLGHTFSEGCNALKEHVLAHSAPIDYNSKEQKKLLKRYEPRRSLLQDADLQRLLHWLQEHV